jgi:hypothetical protein
MTTEVKETNINKKKKKSIFKRWWFWVIIVIVVGSVATSGSDDSTDTASTDTKITDEVSTDTSTEVEPSTEEATEAKAPEAEPTTVFENDQVKISFKEVNSDGLRFLVENKTEKTLTIQGDSVAINGFSVSSNDFAMSSDISPNSKGYADVSTDALSDVGTPEKISGQLRVIDMASADWDTFNATFTDVPLNK